MPADSLLIVIGAACGVLALLFVFFLGQLWELTVPPLYRRWRYRGVNIAGEWKGLGTSHAPASGEWSEVTLALRQDTDEVRGVMTIRHQSTGRSFDLSLHVAGLVADGYATLNLSPVSKATPARATALLKAEADGALNGQLLFRHPFANTVDVINLSVHRAASIATPRLHPVGRPAAGMQAGG